METMIANDEMPLSDAAFQLGITWSQAWKLVLTRKLSGRKREGRWYVDGTDLERLVSEREGSIA